MAPLHSINQTIAYAKRLARSMTNSVTSLIAIVSAILIFAQYFGFLLEWLTFIAGQCDLTAGVCDLNCCCDPECTNNDAFSSCDEEGGPSPMMKMCVERPPSLEAVNLQYPLRLSDHPEVSRFNIILFGILFFPLLTIHSLKYPHRIKSTDLCV